MELAIIGIIFFVCLFSGLPIAFTVGISALSAFFTVGGMNLTIAAQKVIVQTQSFPFLAVPFFLIAGNIMNAAGITTRLVKFAKVLTGHMAGGLAQVSIVLSALMGGISGSAATDTAMEARFLGPSMIKAGYSKGFTSAVLAFGGLITATIPPSMGLILYGFVGDVSIGRLFIAGIPSGIILMALYMSATHFISKKRGYIPDSTVPPTFKEVWTCFKESFWALMFPVVLIVGIRSGFFTTSEAGAFAVVYAIVIGKFVYKELNLKNLFHVLDTATKDNGNMLAIVLFSSIFGFVSAYTGIPRTIAVLITGLSTNPIIVLLTILAFLLIMGMFMETTVITLLTTPIFLPIIKTLGVDPVYFGILMMTIVTMGSMTPPVGVSMFITQDILGCTTKEYTKESLPYMACIFGMIALFLIFPDIVTFLPNLIMG